MDPKSVNREEALALPLVERLGLKWKAQVVSFPVEFRVGRCLRSSLLLVDPQGKPVPFQISDPVSHDRPGRFLRSGRVSFLAGLEPHEAKEYTLCFNSRVEARSAVPAGGLKLARRDATTLEIENGKLAVRVPASERAFRPAALPWTIPAPIQAVKGPDGTWRGKGYLDTYWRVTRYHSEVLEQGPVFATVRTTYEFEQGKQYTVTVRVADGADWIHVSEDSDLGPRSRFVFDCSEGFQPDRLALLTPGTNALVRDLHFFDDVRQARFACFTQFTQLHDFRDGLGVFESGPARDFIGAFLYHPGAWTRPKLNVAEFWERRQLGDEILTRETPTLFGKADAQPDPAETGFQGRPLYDGHFTWEFLLAGGHREWGLAVGSKADELLPGKTARLRNLVMQAGACPLDRAKDLVLDWQEAPLPEPKRLDAHDAEEKKRFIAHLRGFVEGFYNREGWSCTNPVAIRGIAPGCDTYLQWRQEGRFSPEEDRQVRSYYAFLAAMLHDPDYYPWQHSMLKTDDPESTEPLFAGMINQNFNTDRYNMIGAIGLALPAHPQSKEWVAHFTQQLDAQLGFFLYPESGCWEESHTYANHVLFTILPTLHKLQQRGTDLFRDARLKRMFDFFVKTVTPFDKNHGSRITPACGDHREGNEYREIYRTAAEGFAPSDPAFARRLMWLYREQGGTEPSPIEPAPQELGSEYLQGFGAVLRAPDAAGDETYLILRTGPSWGHHHADDNSIHLYAKGAPLVGDAGKGDPAGWGELKYEARGHSRVDLAGVSLVNYLGRTFRGWIKKHVFSDRLDYLLGCTPFLANMAPRKDGNPAAITPIHPGWHDRQILFVRPDYFVIRDTVRTDLYPEEFWLHLDADEVRRDGSTLTAHSKYGVEMDVAFLSPKNPAVEMGSVPGKPVETRSVKIAAPANTDFLWVLFPRKAGQPPATIEALAGGAGVKVTHDGTTDLVFLSHEPVVYKEGDVEFQGCAGMIRLSAGEPELTLADGALIRYGERKVGP